MIDIINCKKKYNEILARQKKAELYLNNKNIDLDTIEKKYIPAYNTIVKQLSLLLIVIGDYDQEEALNGFKI